MSPRPRTVPDEQILLAAQRAMSRLGPDQLTLAEVAKEAGLSRSHARPAIRLEARPDACALGRRRRRRRCLLRGAAPGPHLSARRPPRAATMMSRAHEKPRGDGQPSGVSADRPQRSGVPPAHARDVASGRKPATARCSTKRCAGELVPCDTARLARAVSADRRWLADRVGRFSRRHAPSAGCEPISKRCWRRTEGVKRKRRKRANEKTMYSERQNQRYGKILQL